MGIGPGCVNYSQPIFGILGNPRSSYFIEKGRNGPERKVGLEVQAISFRILILQDQTDAQPSISIHRAKY
jgi:hypothetical protein